MMSYLWILLLGSLLAGSAKAQDDAAPEENTAAPESPTSESDTAPEPEAGEGSDHNAEPTVKEPESADDAEAVTPADEGAVTPADADKEQDTPVDADKEQDTPADADAEPETPKDEGAVTPADGNAEAVTPAADTEAEATTPAQDPAPAADPEVKEPETGEPAEEQPASNTEAPPVQEEDGSEGDTKLAADPTVADNAGPTADAKPTVPVDEDKIVPDSEKGVDALVPTVKVDLPNVDLGLNLEDALPEGNAVDKNARKGKSLGSNAQAAEATGDADKPEAQESSSGSIAGILSAIVVAAVGAVAGYFTYQKKKLCFKDRQADPEAARKADAVEAQSDPQVLSNLLNSS